MYVEKFPETKGVAVFEPSASKAPPPIHAGLPLCENVPALLSVGYTVVVAADVDLDDGVAGLLTIAEPVIVTVDPDDNVERSVAALVEDGLAFSLAEGLTLEVTVLVDEVHPLAV